MRPLVLCVAVLVAGCDPARIARFGIAPTGAGPRADSLQMGEALGIAQAFAQRYQMTLFPADDAWAIPRDRKSTRLNSSHVSISYAVFCLKKKKRASGEKCGR